MMKRAMLAVIATAVLWATAEAAEPEKPEPRYQQAIDTLKRKLGPDFAVKKVGMFVVASELDQARSTKYEELIGKLEAALYGSFISKHPDYVVRIILFKDDASLRANAKKVLQKSPLPGPGGFFFEYERAVLADVSMGEWLLRHELTHGLLFVDFGANRRAPWLDEGLASLMESAGLEGGQVKLRPDWRLGMVYRVMSALKLPHLKDTFKQDFRTYYASPQSRMVSDAMGASFLVYLNEKGVVTQFYKLYRGNFGADPSGVKFVEQVLKKKIDEVETDWLAWVGEQGTKAARPESKQAAP